MTKCKHKPFFYVADARLLTKWIALAVLLFCLSDLGNAHADQPREGKWIADEHGCKAYDPEPVVGESIKWSGKCKDGFVDAFGILHWFNDGKEVSRDIGFFVHGRQERGNSYTDDTEEFCDTSKVNLSKLICVLNSSHSRASGETVAGEFNGIGVQVWGDASYYGNFVGAEKKGKGRLLLSNGGVFEGDLHVDSGLGVYYWPDGARYYGHLRQNKFEGFGIIYHADGTITEGQFSEDKLVSKEPSLANLPPEPHHMPYSVQASALGVEIRDALVAKDVVNVLFLIDQYAALPGVSMPPALQFLQAKVAVDVHLPVLAKAAVEKYLSTAGENDSHYREAVALFVKVKDAKFSVTQ